MRNVWWYLRLQSLTSSQPGHSPGRPWLVPHWRLCQEHCRDWRRFSPGSLHPSHTSLSVCHCSPYNSVGVVISNYVASFPTLQVETSCTFSRLSQEEIYPGWSAGHVLGPTLTVTVCGTVWLAVWLYLGLSRAVSQPVDSSGKNRFPEWGWGDHQIKAGDMQTAECRVKSAVI